jgi:hypothetical protein
MDTTTGLTRTARALLVLAPALLLAGGTMLVRYDDEDWDAVLTAMAAGRGSSDLGWVLALLGCALAVLPALALAGLVRGSRPRAAATASVLLALGWAGAVGICQGGLVMSALAVSPVRTEQIAVLTDLNNSLSSIAFVLCVAGAVGGIVLAVALARVRAVPTGAAVLTGLGTAGTLLVLAGPIRILLLLAAALLLAGCGWVAAAATPAAARAGAPAPVAA